MRTTRRLAEIPGSSGVVGGAAYRNRTDDLRITRSIRLVQGRPLRHYRPARPAWHSTGIRGHPALLLAPALAEQWRSPTGVITCLQIRSGYPEWSLAWVGRFRFSAAIRRDPGSLVSAAGVSWLPAPVDAN
jgi:hypothetical protein